MSYREVPVTAGLLSYLFWNLWPRGLEELGRLGLTPSQAATRLLSYADNGRSGVLLHNNVPVFASGIVAEGGEFVTWFVATSDFQRHWLKITRLLKRECDAHPKPLTIYSVAVHPQTGRWFRALGFEQQPGTTTTASGYPLYRFTRN